MTGRNSGHEESRSWSSFRRRRLVGKPFTMSGSVLGVAPKERWATGTWNSDRAASYPRTTPTPRTRTESRSIYKFTLKSKIFSNELCLQITLDFHSILVIWKLYCILTNEFPWENWAIKMTIEIRFRLGNIKWAPIPVPLTRFESFKKGSQGILFILF